MKTKDIKNNLSAGFQRSAQQFPKRPALDLNDQAYSYEQLAAMAGELMEEIKTIDSPNQKLVALLAYRSPAAYAGILGILGAGCGYVPLHPEFPTERNFKVLDLAQTDRLIVSRECQDAFDGLLTLIQRKMTFILVGMDHADAYAKTYPMHRFMVVKNGGQPEASQVYNIEPVAQDDIAYLLFTSGSTGEPKGVPVSHHNVRSYVEFITKRYDINEHDRCSQMHDMTFDFSIHDIYPTWEKGACLCVATKQDKLLPVSFIQKSKLTSWASVPSIAVIIDKYGRLEADVFANLRYSFFCGEALFRTTTEKWQKAAPHSKIINLYGPTETTMAISCYDWDSQRSPAECVNGIVPIGRVFDGNVARVEEGELCLSGSQVTKGYWNNPKQTALQYVTFQDTRDTLWYRTGDLVQMDKDGSLYYLGRVDNQIKILGNRVELGEIDKVLREASGTELAVAIPWPANTANANGVIGVVCSTAQKMDEAAIFDYCRNKLPSYMVPTKIHLIEEMPLNANGKIDRLQLKHLLKQPMLLTPITRKGNS